MTEKSFWEKLKKIGWLRFIPKVQQKEIRSCLKKNFKANPKWAYLCLNQSSFDAECIDHPGIYSEILKGLARDSHGLFRPTHLKETDVRLTKRRVAIKVSFRHDGESFSTVVPYESDYFEIGVIDLVNQALAAGQVEERFIELPPIDQCVFLVLVPPAIYEKAVSAKLIPARHTIDEEDNPRKTIYL